MRAIEFITEEINRDCFNPAFNDTQHFDDLTYRATVEEEGGKKLFVVQVFNDNFERVAFAKFKPYKDANNNYWVESQLTGTRPNYRGKGIINHIYAYVRMLGNTIKPSKDQSNLGADMWQHWKDVGDAEHLTK